MSETDKLPDEWSFSSGTEENALLNAARKIVDEEFPNAPETSRAWAARRIEALAGSYASDIASGAVEGALYYGS